MNANSKSTPFGSVLIANRGEIALRVMKTARTMGLKTIAIYTAADASAEFAAFADQSVLIGQGPVGDSYLSVDTIIAAAQSTGAEAIHPGYGFLSESAEFAKACENAGIIFVGPRPETIEAMGDKANAKKLMRKAKVDCVPGYDGAEQSDRKLQAEADAIGFPVMIKAAAGGGGRGMRLVAQSQDMKAALALARLEASQAFGSDSLILEKAINRPRHIEIQLMADRHGAILHLGERDCSVQRRHQKVIEEAPSPIVNDDLRLALGKTAIRAAKAIGYEGAGTVEFLLDSAGNFYFLEMNTRLQVEHPVTEMVTGLDLVAMQFAIARGEPLAIAQSDMAMKGHAIEVRLYAEDPDNGFLPITGPILQWQKPGKIRVDCGIVSGQEVSPYYDPMLAKLVAWGETREKARLALVQALQETVLLGVKSNRDFLIALLREPVFAKGRATTEFIADHQHELFADSRKTGALELAILAACWYRERQSKTGSGNLVAQELLGWSSTGKLDSRLILTIDGTPLAIELSQHPEGLRIVFDQKLFHARWKNEVLYLDDVRTPVIAFLETEGECHLALRNTTISVEKHRAASGSRLRGQAADLLAPMHGNITEISVSVSDKVTKGQRLAVLEAMKMQHELLCQHDGIVVSVNVNPGQQVKKDDLLFEIKGEKQN